MRPDERVPGETREGKAAGQAVGVAPGSGDRVLVKLQAHYAGAFIARFV